MPNHRSPSSRLLVAMALACALLAAPAGAERADRTKQLVIEADQRGSIDVQGQLVTVWTGNATFSQGSLQLRADRIEVRELADGYYAAIATGTAAKPVSWHQRGDRPGEAVEGQAERIEFDGHSNTLKLIGHAAVRRLRDGVVADETEGASMVWDNQTGSFKGEGGAKSPTNPSGRVRMVLTPKPEAGASGPRGAASAPPALTPSRSLGNP